MWDDESTTSVCRYQNRLVGLATSRHMQALVQGLAMLPLEPASVGLTPFVNMDLPRQV